MGTWSIEIKGHGHHHNQRADDANALAAGFVKVLRESGHDVSAASFVLTDGNDKPTPDGTSDLLAPLPPAQR